MLGELGNVLLLLQELCLNGKKSDYASVSNQRYKRAILKAVNLLGLLFLLDVQLLGGGLALREGITRRSMLSVLSGHP